jgi:hypothetical protein
MNRTGSITEPSNTPHTPGAGPVGPGIQSSPNLPPNFNPEQPIKTMTLHCLAIESPKNIPFVLSLAASRLTSRNGNRTISVESPPPEREDDLPRVQSGKENTFLDPKDLTPPTPLISGSIPYTDELEYSLAGQDTSEGDIVVDLGIFIYILHVCVRLLFLHYFVFMF